MYWGLAKMTEITHQVEIKYLGVGCWPLVP